MNTYMMYKVFCLCIGKHMDTLNKSAFAQGDSTPASRKRQPACPMACPMG